jgi:hypothetical protein
MHLPEFHDVFRAILGWNGDLGYIIRVHGQEFNSFRRKRRSTALHEFKLHRQEKFLYICDTLHMWEWDVRVLDIQDGVEGRACKGVGCLIKPRGARDRSSAGLKPACQDRNACSSVSLSTATRTVKNGWSR